MKSLARNDLSCLPWTISKKPNKQMESNIRPENDFSCNSHLSDIVCEVFQWNQENIQSQLPVSVSGLLSFTLALNGVGDFLVPNSYKGRWLLYIQISIH